MTTRKKSTKPTKTQSKVHNEDDVVEDVEMKESSKNDSKGTKKEVKKEVKKDEKKDEKKRDMNKKDKKEKEDKEEDKEDKEEKEEKGEKGEEKEVKVNKKTTKKTTQSRRKSPVRKTKAAPKAAKVGVKRKLKDTEDEEEEDEDEVKKDSKKEEKEKEKEKKEKEQPKRKKLKVESDSEKSDNSEDDSDDGIEQLWQDWKQIFLIGTEWEIYDTIFQTKWDFNHLKEKLEEYSLSKNYTYIFGATEGHPLPDVKNPGKVVVTLVPTFTVVDCKLPPPSEVAITSVMRGTEDIRSMRTMKMDWIPYFVTPSSASSDEAKTSTKKRRSTKVSSKIYFLTCHQRKQSIKRMVNAKDEKNEKDRELNRLKDYEYAVPYVWIPKNDENIPVETSVNVIETCAGKGLTFEYDWDMDDLTEFVDDLLKQNDLEEEHREEVTTMIKNKVKEAKDKIRAAKQKKNDRLKKMKAGELEALNTLQCYKFYPQNKDLKIEQTNFINRFYGKAVKVYPEVAENTPSFQFTEVLPQFQNLRTIADDITN